MRRTRGMATGPCRENTKPRPLSGTDESVGGHVTGHRATRSRLGHWRKSRRVRRPGSGRKYKNGCGRDCGSRSTVPLFRRSAARRFGLCGRFTQNRRRRRLCGAVDGVVVWRGIALGGPYFHKKGVSVIPSAHKHSRAGLCRQDSGRAELPGSTADVGGCAWRDTRPDRRGE